MNLDFYGNIVSTAGLKPGPKKVDNIIKMPAPTNKKELSSFLGMCQYLNPYVPRLSNTTSTLHELSKKAANFTWNSSYDRMF